MAEEGAQPKSGKVRPVDMLRQTYDDLWYYGGEFGPETFTLLLATPPGSGKTTGALDVAQRLWKERGLKTLYLMLNHDPAIAEALGILERDGGAEDWAHWRGHEDGCHAKQLMDLGYVASLNACTCTSKRTTTFTADKPTIAPIDYILNDPWAETPIRPDVLDFDLWVIDEIDFGRLVEGMDVSSADVRKVLQTHPSPIAKALCTALATILADLEGELDGPALYARVDDQLGEAGAPDLGTILGHLKAEMGTWPRQPWAGLTETFRPHPPPNFMPPLVHLLAQEVIVDGRTPVNPRVHLNRDRDGQSRLHLRWRKVVTNADMVPERLVGRNTDGTPLYLPVADPPTYVLDATADADLLERVFPGLQKAPSPVTAPDWPVNVIVHQDTSKRGTKTDMGLIVPGREDAPENKAKRDRYYEQIRRDLQDTERYPRDWPVGIITFRAIKDEAADFLRSLGFSDVKSLHYWAVRSSNELREVRLLVLLGSPIAGVEEFRWEAQAYLVEEEGLDFCWTQQTVEIDMRGDWPYEVEPYDYNSHRRVHAYSWQKCQYELYQAVCRIRPYTPTEYDRHIFVYTNTPIPYVTVDELLDDSGRRFQRARNVLAEALQTSAAITIPELAHSLPSTGIEERSEQEWVRENAPRLAAATGALYVAGKGRRAGQFSRQMRQE